MTSTHLPQGVVCTIPPAGWHCTRAPGHDGPCAAHPTETAWEGPLTDKENAMLEAAWQKHKDAAPPTPATEEREAVARAISTRTYAVCVKAEDCGEWHEMSERARDVYRTAADAALSALAPTRTTERATEYARGLADGVMQSEAAIVAWLRDDCPGCPYVAERGIANAIERREHAQEAGNERNHG